VRVNYHSITMALDDDEEGRLTEPGVPASSVQEDIGQEYTEPAPTLICGHPPGLVVLFMAEMWERFSYYGMRSLLVLFLNNVLLQPDHIGNVYGLGLLAGPNGLYGDPEDDPDKRQAISSKLYGLYTGLVYFTPVAGGLIADQFLGQYTAVLIGGVLMAAGHLCMVFEEWFILAIGLLILGNGLFKPNISTQVGRLYEENDPKRDQAFSIFYAGINMGAMLSPLVCGTLGETVSYHTGFAAAGVGMMIGLAVFWFGRKWLPADPKKQQQQPDAAPSLAQVGLCKTLADNKRRVSTILLVSVFTVVFWAVYEQQGNTIQLFATEYTDMMLLPGVKIPSTWIQSLNPLFILTLIPLVNKFWGWQATRGQEPSSVAKMAIGCVISATAYLLMVFAATLSSEDQTCSVWWLVLSILWLTVGELYASPVGLSFVTQAAPAEVASMLMGTWFLCTGIGGYMAGEIGALYSTLTKPGFFMFVCVIGVGNGLVLAILVKRINKVLNEDMDSNSQLEENHSQLDGNPAIELEAPDCDIAKGDFDPRLAPL